MEKIETNNIKARIWLTSKSRMNAEARFRKYNQITHILLCLLSVILISITVLSGSLPAQVPVDAYSVVFSVFILAFSIVVFGFNFGETSVLHRECYLSLQKLYDSRDSAEEIERNYHSILSSYPNHSNLDYERLVLSKTFPQKKGMSDPNGVPISWDMWMLIKQCFHEIIIWGLSLGLLILSVGSMFLFWG